VPRPTAEPTTISVAKEMRGLAIFPSDLSDVVRDATDAKIFEFDPADEFTPPRSVAAATISDAGLLPRQSLEKLRRLVLSPDSYQLSPLGVAHRFVPNYAFRFSSNGREAWWLLADDGRLAVGMLVAKDTVWRRSPSLVIRDAARRAFQVLRTRGQRSG
jgi:hypothetical protein